jgi:hypothetical protein
LISVIGLPASFPPSLHQPHSKRIDVIRNRDLAQQNFANDMRRLDCFRVGGEC